MTHPVIEDLNRRYTTKKIRANHGKSKARLPLGACPRRGILFKIEKL